MGSLQPWWRRVALLAALVVLIARMLKSGGLTYAVKGRMLVYDGLAETIPPKVSFNVTQDMQRRYTSDGILVLRGVLPLEWVQQLLNISMRVKQERYVSGHLPTFSAAGTALYSNWQENKVIQQFWTDSGIARVIANVVQAPEIRLFEDLISLADPIKNWYACWHSDWYSFGNVVEPQWTYSVWLPLSDIPRQRGGSIHLCTRDALPKNCTTGTGPPVFACERGEPPGYCEDAVEANCPAPEFREGDVVVFAKDSVHRTEHLVDHGFQRYAMVGRFVDGRATYLPSRTAFLNSYTYKIMHDMCAHGLQAGDRFGGPCFPRIFPQPDYAEIYAERQYATPMLMATMAFLEKVWFGENFAQ